MKLASSPIHNPWYRGYYVKGRNGKLYTSYANRKTEKPFKTKAAAQAFQDSWDGSTIVYFDGVRLKSNPARRSRKKTKRKTRTKVTRARRNPKGIAKSLKYRRGSHRQRYVEAAQMERLAKRIRNKKLLADSRELKSRLIVTRSRRNPAPIRYAPTTARRAGFHIIEGLVRDSPHDRKFSYWYYTGTGFSKDRQEAFRYPNHSAGENAMRKIVNYLPSKVLQIRVIAS